MNAWLWGGPFLTAYSRAAVFGPDGLRVVDHAGAFGTNPLAGVAKLVASYPHGLVIAFPLLVPPPLGFLVEEARREEWRVPMASWRSRTSAAERATSPSSSRIS